VLAQRISSATFKTWDDGDSDMNPHNDDVDEHGIYSSTTWSARIHLEGIISNEFIDIIGNHFDLGILF
jgi:hypothetical protein